VVRVLALVSATLGLALSPAQDIGHIDAYVRSQMDAAQVPGLALGVVQVRGFGAADDSGRAEAVSGQPYADYVRQQILVAPLLINIAWAVLVLAALLWLVANLATGLPQLLLLLPWQVSLLLVSGAFAAAWAFARTGLMVVVRARRRDLERTC
jgi:hypothetical protein